MPMPDNDEFREISNHLSELIHADLRGFLEAAGMSEVDADTAAEILEEALDTWNEENG